MIGEKIRLEFQLNAVENKIIRRRTFLNDIHKENSEILNEYLSSDHVLDLYKDEKNRIIQELILL